jgi:hypothetical protein
MPEECACAILRLTQNNRPCAGPVVGSGSLESFRRIAPPYILDTAFGKNVVNSIKKAGQGRPAFLF